MRQYYFDTSVLLVYTLAGGSEPERHAAVRKLFGMIEEGRLKAVTSFYALPHAVSAKIWGCDGIVAYDEHFRAVSDVIEYKTPEEITGESDITSLN